MAETEKTPQGKEPEQNLFQSFYDKFKGWFTGKKTDENSIEYKKRRTDEELKDATSSLPDEEKPMHPKLKTLMAKLSEPTGEDQPKGKFLGLKKGSSNA